MKVRIIAYVTIGDVLDKEALELTLTPDGARLVEMRREPVARYLPLDTLWHRPAVAASELWLKAKQVWPPVVNAC